MQLSTTLSPFYDRTLPAVEALPAAVRNAADAGFFVLDCPLHNLPIVKDGAQWEETVRAALDAAKETGAQFRYGHVPFSYPAEGDAEGWARFDRSVHKALDIAAAMDIRTLAIHPHGMPVAHYSFDKTFDHACEHIRPFAEHAKSLGLTLCVENMVKRAMTHMRRFGEVPEDILAVAEALDLGVCWDTGHANCSGIDQYGSIMKLAPRLRMVHINDNLGLGDDHVPPMIGTTDWEGVVRALVDCGFTGDFNFEVGTLKIPSDAFELRRTLMLYLRQSGEYLLAKYQKQP